MDASAAVSSRLIGAIFVEKGLVTPDQLERAMQIQAETGDRLGEVIVGRVRRGPARARQRSRRAVGGVRADGPAAGRCLSRPSPPSLTRYPSSRCCAARSARSSSTAVSSRTSSSRRQSRCRARQGSGLARCSWSRAACHVSIWRAPWPSSGRTCRSCGHRSPWSRTPGTAAPSSSRLQLRLSRELSASLADLESRVRVVERAAAASPWEEDLGRLSTELRAAIVALEQRVRHQRTVARNRPKASRRPSPSCGSASTPPSPGSKSSSSASPGAVTADMLDARLAALDQLSHRLDELAQRAVVAEALDELRARVEELAAGSTQNAGVDALRAEHRPARQRVHTSETCRRAGSRGQARRRRRPGGGCADRACRARVPARRPDRAPGARRRPRRPRARRGARRARCAGRCPSSPPGHRPPTVRRRLSASIGALGARLDQLAAQVEEITSAAADAGDDELRAAVDGSALAHRRAAGAPRRDGERSPGATAGARAEDVRGHAAPMSQR